MKASKSSKAEERALEAYPVEMVSGPISYKEPKFDLNAFGRHIFQEGYKQAEKDNELTWEDIEKILTIIVEEFPQFAKRDKYFYEEVLKRFKEAKK